MDAIDEDVTHAYDQINDLSEELEDLEADLYEDDDTDDDDEEPEEDAEDAEDSGDDDDNADVAGEPYYEVACPACGNTVYVSEDDLDVGEAICPSCNVGFEVALADEDDDEAPEEPDDGPARYEVTCPACGATSVVDEEALLDGEPVCPNCGKHINVFGDSHVDEIADKYKLPVLAKMPIDPELAKEADAGMIEMFAGDYLDNAAQTVAKLLKK